ncbi:MAG: hypothetical protein IT449_12575 [Phycisphaerales bacterium]|nr:hypothetical protein [Phycisphaerales bacterium]
MSGNRKGLRVFISPSAYRCAAAIAICLSCGGRILGDEDCPLTCGVVDDPCYCEPPSTECICVEGVCTPHYVTYEDTFSFTPAETGNTCLGHEGVECGYYWNCIPVAAQSSCANNAGCKHFGQAHFVYAIKYTTGEANCSPPT